MNANPVFISYVFSVCSGYLRNLYLRYITGLVLCDNAADRTTQTHGNIFDYFYLLS